MGAWGAGIFESDGALDFLEGLLRLQDPRDEMQRAFGTAIGAGYLDADAGGAALVSAAVIKAAILKEPLLPRQSAAWSAWQKTIDRLNMTALKAPAIKACRRVLAEGSELRELWSENAKLFQQWQGAVAAIIHVLEK